MCWSLFDPFVLIESSRSEGNICLTLLHLTDGWFMHHSLKTIKVTTFSFRFWSDLVTFAALRDNILFSVTRPLLGLMSLQYSPVFFLVCSGTDHIYCTLNNSGQCFQQDTEAPVWVDADCDRKWHVVEVTVDRSEGKFKKRSKTKSELSLFSFFDFEPSSQKHKLHSLWGEARSAQNAKLISF